METFNLFVHWIEKGNIDGALALTARRALGDRAGIAETYRKFQEVMSRTKARMVAFAGTTYERIAVVHCHDHAPGATRVDVDPAFLLKEEAAWAVLPIFSRPPDEGVPYLSTEENAELRKAWETYLVGKHATHLAELTTHSGALKIPAAAGNDPGSREVARIWVAKGAQHLTLRVDQWPDPGAWGILLADLAGHAANAYASEGQDSARALARIRELFDVESRNPTDSPRGKVVK